MKYMRLGRAERTALVAGLEAMPDFLTKRFASLSADEAARPGPGDAFSPVEQCWHLADLEREGYAVRITRLLTEHEPALPDFDGTRIARERNYKSLSMSEGIAAFREARAANVAALRRLSEREWERRGTQEGVGSIGLCDVPAMMAEHDEAHRKEIDAWVRARRV